MGAAAMAYVVWQRHLRHDPTDPAWLDRDRFVLSAGHGSMLLYGLLHLTGYDLPIDQLRNFRQFGSLTPGHPEAHITPGVEATTGPLGQGFGNGVGMAIAERFLAARYNRPGHALIDHYTYVLCSDGLTGMVPEEGILRSVMDNQDDVEAACRKLIDFANERGGYDTDRTSGFHSRLVRHHAANLQVATAPTAGRLRLPMRGAEFELQVLTGFIVRRDADEVNSR